MSLETLKHQTDIPDIDRALAHYRCIFEGDEVTESSVLAMEVGDSGYCAYWAVSVDSSGRYWLAPLSTLDAESSDSAVLIKREAEGYIADFSSRVVRGRDRFYDEVIPESIIDSIEPEGFYGLPLVEVVAATPEQLPGYYCDEDGNSPSPGKNGELYTAFD